MHAILELAKKKTVIFDGAMGTMLMEAGLKAGDCPELWNIEKLSLVAEIHRRYYEAGSDAVHTNTFGGNAVKLADRGLSEKAEIINVEAAKLAREACPAGKFVAGDIGPTGKLLKPLGDLVIEEAEEAFLDRHRPWSREGWISSASRPCSRSRKRSPPFALQSGSAMSRSSPLSPSTAPRMGSSP